MPIPDVVIAGAPKCGTTALAAALATHPEFFVGPNKEPRFFADIAPYAGPMSAAFNETILSERPVYEANFAGADGRRTVDASTDYLSSPGTAARIAQANPNAKIIIGLRDPVARCRSEHLHLLRSEMEPLDLLEALHVEEERIAKRWVPLFHHVRRSLYADGIEEFHDGFGEANVFVYRHDHLRDDPETVMVALADFLGTSSPIEMVGDYNVGGAPRSHLVNRAMRSDRQAVRAIRRMLTWRWSTNVKKRVRNTVDRANLNRSIEVSQEARDWIVGRVGDDLRRVEKLTSLDLSDWIG